MQVNLIGMANSKLKATAETLPGLLRLGPDRATNAIAEPAPAVTPNDDNTHKFHTSRRYPIYYLAITKCGSTALKNFFYLLDNDAPHPNPSYIHDYRDDLIRADRTPPWMIRRSFYSFAVIRKPTSRFLSFYFDKIYGDHPQNFGDRRVEIAADAGIDLTPGLSVEAHRENATALINWIAKNLRNETNQPVNPHWRPQFRRLRAVEKYALKLVTLDGLDEQLSSLLKPVIPDIAKRLAEAPGRNPASYPVSPEEVLDDDLRTAVNTVYAKDEDLHADVSATWKRRFAKAPAPAVSQGTAAKITALTTHRFPLNTLVMPKAGISYLRNLHYALDHGRMHPMPASIENDHCLLKVSKTSAELENQINIIVLRDPIARFFSLYFDKVWSEGSSAFPWIAAKLEKNRRFAKGEITAEHHHDNCCRLLGYLEKRFRENKPKDLNPHWRPQSLRAVQAADFGFHPLLLERFPDQIRQVAGRRIRGLDAALDAVTYRNASSKPVSTEELKSDIVMDRLHALYGEDIALYQRIRAGWDETKAPPPL